MNSLTPQQLHLDRNALLDHIWLTKKDKEAIVLGLARRNIPIDMPKSLNSVQQEMEETAMALFESLKVNIHRL
jgi:hypothetical protein